ncbi:relaxase/mobilization nuclease domain-containing protein [Turicibacter sanguinis]|uniref:relaxase/mobilization nuclease domain-containing protein n=1 Tax=Turicibacter sanguinis TaxID=154288 RepID=UPI003995B546
MAYVKMKAIKTTVKKALDYILREEKVGEKNLVYGHEVTPEFADLEFEMTLESSKRARGDYSKVGGKENLAYHLIQSFNPKDKVSPELAHELGKKLAEQFTKGDFEFVVSTHTDTDHVHNHIIINAYSHKTLNKMITMPYKTIAEIKSISNKLCLENGLTPSDIQRGTDTKNRYKSKTQPYVKPTTLREQLKTLLDQIISKSNTIDEFKNNLILQNIDFKEGKQWSFKLPHSKRFMRGDTLGEDYTRKRILERLGEPLNVLEVKDTQKITIHDKPLLGDSYKWRKNKVKNSKSNQSINFEQRLFYQARNQQIQDVKELANQLLFIRTENIKSMSDFDKRIREIWSTGKEIQTNIKKLESKYQNLGVIYKELSVYQEHKDVYDKYQNMKLKFNKERFYNAHMKELNLVEGSLNILGKYNVKTDTDIMKVKETLQDINRQLQALKQEYRVINNKVDKIREVRDYAEQINRQQPRQEKEVNRVIGNLTL